MLNIKHNNRQWLLNTSLALAAAAMLNTSCGDDDTALPIDEVQPDNPAPVEQPSQPDNAAQTYTANIPATIGGESLSKAVAISGTTATGTFQTTEKIYVYNATKGTMLDGVLNPSDISTDGKKCSLSGSLTGTIDAGDQLTLLYNLTNLFSDPASCYFYYNSQSGTEVGLCDGGVATDVSATFSNNGVLSCESVVEFVLQQSVFRFKFQDGDGNAISVKNLDIKDNTKQAISQLYRPLDVSSRYGSSQIVVTPATATSDYLYVSVCIKETESDGSTLDFTVTDANNNIYTGTKSAPTGGFKNGKFYYNSSPITLTKQSTLVEPTITGTSTSANEYNCYDVRDANTNITISGISAGYYFWLDNAGTVTLDGLTAVAKQGSSYFLYSADKGDLNLILKGDNTISAADAGQAIFVDGTLKISGNGTLTVTTQYSRYGLYANNYKNGSNSDPQVLAAEGYAVTREIISNGSSTQTCKYTVTPTNN